MRKYFAFTLIFAITELFSQTVKLSPDYANITIPPNIAPMNFDVEGTEKNTRVVLKGRKTELVKKTPNIRFSQKEWRNFLEENRGGNFTIAINDFVATNTVATEEIDSTLVYRLIPPSYEQYGEMGIYQRDLTSFKESPVYENRQTSRRQCVNCHAFKSNDSETLSLHIRAENSGTLIYKNANDAGIKRNFKVGPFISSGTYPAWHPSGNYIAYAICETKQAFFERNPNKIEVLDLQSDMAIYHLPSDTITPIELDKNAFECFPSWSPDGKTLYTVRADVNFKITNDSFKNFANIIPQHTNIYYNLIARNFNSETGEFSKYFTILDAAQGKKSVTHPRVSPDGKWLIFTVGGYGIFHIWHKDSDLWLIDLKNRSLRELTEVNSADVDSYHSFSSNGAWMVLSSRRDDGAYTRPYFFHFDTNRGIAAKPFIIPVKNPKEHLMRMTSYNIPEFVTSPIKRTPATLRKLQETKCEDAKIRISAH